MNVMFYKHHKGENVVLNQFCLFDVVKACLMFQVAHFKDYIPQAFPGGHSMILDAEVLLIDTQTSKPLPFGTLGIHKVSSSSLLLTSSPSFTLRSSLTALASRPSRKQPFRTPTCAFLFSTAFTSTARASWRGTRLREKALPSTHMLKAKCCLFPQASVRTQEVPARQHG